MSLTERELRESLLFYRRRLTERITLAMVKRGVDHKIIAESAEDLANTTTERIAARETGVVEGYGKLKQP